MIAVKCPVCGGTDISKNGISRNDKQKYLCNAKECGGKSFMLEYRNNGCKPGIENRPLRKLSRRTQRVVNTANKRHSQGETSASVAIFV